MSKKTKSPVKLSVYAYTKLQTLIAAYVGLVAGIIYSFGGLIIDGLVSLGWVTSTQTPGLSYGTLLAFGSLIGMPIYFAVFGFLTGIIGALLYNMVSPLLGGISLKIKE